MSKKTNRVWLTSNLKTLSWVSFLQDAASEMLYPILPVLLNTVLGAPAAVVGAIEGAAEGTAAITKLLSKRINRWMKRKHMIGLGYSLAALGKLLIALASVWPLVLVARVVDRLGKGLRSAPRDAIILSEVSAEHRGRVIGFHRTADTLGAVLGPTLTLALLALLDNQIEPLLWIAVVPAVLSALAVVLVKDNEPRVGLAMRNGEEHVAAPPQSTRLNRNTTRTIGFLAVFSLVNFPDALILLHLSQTGFSVTEVVALYLLFNLSYAALSFPAGMLADRIAPKYVYALGLLCFAVAYIGLGVTQDPLVSALLVMVYGGFSACNDTVGKSWVAKLAPASEQLAAQSYLQGFSGLAVLAAGIWAGLAWNLGAGTGTWPLVFSGSVAVAVAIWLARS